MGGRRMYPVAPQMYYICYMHAFRAERYLALHWWYGGSRGIDADLAGAMQVWRSNLLATRL